MMISFCWMTPLRSFLGTTTLILRMRAPSHRSSAELVHTVMMQTFGMWLRNANVCNQVGGGGAVLPKVLKAIGSEVFGIAPVGVDGIY